MTGLYLVPCEFTFSWIIANSQTVFDLTLDGHWSQVHMNSFRKTAILEFAFVCLYFLVRKEPFGIHSVYMKNGLLPQKGQLLLVAKFCSF